MRKLAEILDIVRINTNGVTVHLANRFINNEIKVFGSYFKEFEDPRGANEFTLKVNVNDLKTEKEVLQW